MQSFLTNRLYYRLAIFATFQILWSVLSKLSVNGNSLSTLTALTIALVGSEGAFMIARNLFTRRNPGISPLPHGGEPAWVYLFCGTLVVIAQVLSSQLSALLHASAPLQLNLSHVAIVSIDLFPLISTVVIVYFVGRAVGRNRAQTGTPTARSPQ